MSSIYRILPRVLLHALVPVLGFTLSGAAAGNRV